jgi:hypothetical protein
MIVTRNLNKYTTKYTMCVQNLENTFIQIKYKNKRTNMLL